MKEREDEERRVFPIHSSNPAVCSFAVTSRGASLSSLSANEILPSFVVAEWKVEREEPKLSKQNLLLFFRESITEAPPSQSHARRTPLTFHPEMISSFLAEREEDSLFTVFRKGRFVTWRRFGGRRIHRDCVLKCCRFGVKSVAFAGAILCTHCAKGS